MPQNPRTLFSGNRTVPTVGQGKGSYFRNMPQLLEEEKLDATLFLHSDMSELGSNHRTPQRYSGISQGIHISGS
jgi:hypothetical protein